MPREVDADWWEDRDAGLCLRWFWCHDDIVQEVCAACAMCNADNVELQAEGYDQVLVSKMPHGETHLIEWRWSRGER